MNISLKTLRKYAKSPEQICLGKNDNEPVFYWFGDLVPYVWADHVDGGPAHTGWFTNDDSSGKARGIVVTLPAMPGFPDGRFLAGYWWGDNGEFTAWPELYSDEGDAAQMADEHARVFAESARDDSERFDAMQDAEHAAEHAAENAGHAFKARQVSEWHREDCREKLDVLRDARDALIEANAAYEKG